MESKSNEPPLICIVGETASGKTGLAIELAQQFNGEIIAADSRTVYRGMDIGTAKPTAEEQAAIPHHLLDEVDPDESFTVAEFKRLAQEAITDIASRNKIPFLVGGSGLYVDAVIYNFGFRGSANVELREELALLTVEELQTRLLSAGIPLPKNERNPRHLIRALETDGLPAHHSELRPNTLVLRTMIDRDELKTKIVQRVDWMVDRGFMGEVKTLSERFGWEAPGLQAPGYKAFRSYLEGRSSLEEAKDQFVRNDLQLAKRQRTWFNRNKSVHHIRNKDEAVALVTTFLNNASIAN